MQTLKRVIERRRLPLCYADGRPVLPEWLHYNRRRAEVEALLYQMKQCVDPDLARRRRILWLRISWVGLSVILAILFMFRKGMRPPVARVYRVGPDRAIYQWSGFYRVAI